MCWTFGTPLLCIGEPNGPTERAPKKSCLMEMDITAVEGGGHSLRTNRQHAVAVAWRAQKVIVRSDLLARPKILDGSKHDFFPRNGTCGHE